MHPAIAEAERLYRELPHGRRPTRLHVHLVAKLAHWRSATPTHRALARAARCSRRTVVRGLARLRDLGLLSWAQRTVCGRGFAVRVSNRYSFIPKPLESIRIPCSAELAHLPTQAIVAVLRKAEARVMAAWEARRLPAYRG